MPSTTECNRAGCYVTQPTGYASFRPAKLPPVPELKIDAEMLSLLSKADQCLGRLDGVTQTLPNPDLFVSMYVKKEALLSSQIEGTQASLIEVIAAEENQSQDVREVTNYVHAMNYGLERLKSFPLSLRLLREIHAELLRSGRGSDRNPGEFRTTQNWIGPAGCTLNNAVYVPPALDDMRDALDNLEHFFYDQDDMPALIKIALIHAQFETIHPFIDGNGRVGRLLITFWLCHQKILNQPLLYLSYFFKRNRTAYYDKLMDIREKGLWEEWIKFFLTGIIAISEESIASAQEIDALRTSLTEKVDTLDGVSAANARRLLDQLFITPQVTRVSVANALNISKPTAGALISKFCDELSILVDAHPTWTRNKVYLFEDYLDILEVGTD